MIFLFTNLEFELIYSNLHIPALNLSISEINRIWLHISKCDDVVFYKFFFTEAGTTSIYSLRLRNTTNANQNGCST